MTARCANLFTIPATSSFVDALAAGLLQHSAGDPAALSAMTILVPNRRAVRGLREAFLRRSEGKALLLPTMRPIGDVAEDELLLSGVDLAAADIPPAIDPLRRQIILARYLAASRPDEFTIAQGLAMAAELGRLIDSVHTEGLTLDNLDHLVADTYAKHWEISLSFLNDVLRVHWPQQLEAEGAIDPALRRRLMIEAYTNHLQSNPPANPIIGAGSTGSIPATAQLLKTIAYLPNGQVILPGLDQQLDEDSWQATNEGHPQHVMRLLLQTMEATRDNVKLWPGVAKGDGRKALISEIMRPAQTTAAWKNIVAAEGFDHLMLLEADHLDQEAAAIALMLRDHAQKVTSESMMLVTPDRILSGRVAQILRRWDINIDDSAGLPLAHTPVGAWLLTLAATWADGFAPISLLATLKHTLSGGGADETWRNFVRDLDQYLLRGVRPAPGINGLLHRLADDTHLQKKPVAARLQKGLENLQTLLAPMLANPHGSLSIIRALLQTAENLASTPDIPGAQRLWSGDDGEAAANLFASLLDQGDVLPDLAIGDLSDVLRTAMAGATVRPRFGTHPRLAILGPIEARLYQAETVILGSLNEGTWPALPEVDGWMSRPMRRDFNLPQPERAITLTAHDFCQGLGAANVVLTRSKNRDGGPTTPSRWLQRLDAVRDACKGPDIRLSAAPWLAIAARMDLSTDFAKPATRPIANPPLPARPDALSVTDIATLQRDPYAIYAKHTLGLRAWDPIDADPGAKDRGNLIHKALETFSQNYPNAWPEKALDKMLDLGRKVFASAHDHPDVLGHWWPRFERMARALDRHEANWRSATKHVHTEIQGKQVLDVGGRNVILTGRADRLEQRIGSGWAIIDYKSGVIPSVTEVKSHKQPQLTLLGAMLRAGVFNDTLQDTGPFSLDTLTYWPIGGNKDTIQTPKAFADDLNGLSDEALDHVLSLLRSYLIDGVPFQSWPDMRGLPRDNRSYDYAHLERMAEWRNDTEDEEEAA